MESEKMQFNKINRFYFLTIHDMDKMCNKSGTEDLNTTITNPEETEYFTNRSSPVFKCCNNIKTVRGNNLDSSDYDIPSYQVNQSVKSRTSSKYDSETSESVLPFTPIFSPIPIAASVQFQPPSVLSLGTIVKNIDRSCQNNVSSSTNPSRVQTIKTSGVFESLGMNDKDISWVSSMATPPPKNIPGSEFNTVEKATFFPEEKFQNIQPRALFSPPVDDDCGCHPIIFTSESDDDEEYKSNIRLSDVCATLRQLEFRSLDQNNSLEKVIVDKDCIISPIIKTKKKKLGSTKKKKKGSLVISPDNNKKYEFTVGENMRNLEYENIKPNNESNFIEDDSFQSMSFSGIDELCKTLVREQSTCVASKTDCDKTIISAKDNNIVKKFYSTSSAPEVYEVSTMDNLHSYAKALEEGDMCNLKRCKTNQLLPQSDIVRVDTLCKDTSKIDGIKRTHSEITEENDECTEKKLKMVEEENLGWENMKQYLSESQLNVSDGEIFRTVENLERTLASQESKDSEKLHTEKLQGEGGISQNSYVLSSFTETSGNSQEVTRNEPPKCSHKVETCELQNNGAKHFDADPLSVPIVGFTTAAGSKITFSEKALNKAREILRECDENLDLDEKTATHYSNLSDKQFEPSIPGESDGCHSEVLRNELSVGSSKQVKVSAETEARTFMPQHGALDVSEKLSNQMNIQGHENQMSKCTENMIGFFTGSGKQIQVSEEALEKAKAVMSEFDDLSKEHSPFVKSDMEGFSTSSGKKIQVSSKALERAKTLMAECDKGEKDPWLKSSKVESKGKKTLNCGKNSTDNSGEDCATTSAGLILFSARQYEEKPKENFSFKGFSTGSGKIIQVSAEALEKAKLLMMSCESEFIKEPIKFASKLTEKPDNEPQEMIEISNGKPLGNKNEEANCGKVWFSTASGNKVDVSKKALEKARELWSECAENTTKKPGTSTFPQTVPPITGFITARGSKVNISEAAFAKAKERMKEWEQIKPEDYGTVDCITENLNTSMKNASQNTERTTKMKENVSEMPSTSVINESNDWDEIIPSWLHVYNTSPSIASERTELSPLLCHEDGNSSKPARDYIIKSPVLGKGDRFHGKIKKRKLCFEDQKEIEGKTKSSFMVPSQKKRTSNLTLDFSVPFKKMKFVEVGAVESLNIKAERARARAEQDKNIKEKQKVKPVKGSHLSRKCCEKQISWREAVTGSSPEMHSAELLKSFGISEDVLQINIENAVSYRFKGEGFFGSSCATNIKGFPVGDECLLILDDENKFGVEELKRAFLASPGVQPNLMAHGWVENHLKWIIWKLANYERCFPQYFGGKCLTPNHIMLQLKYRYDREIDRNERSALKKILERDDTSIKRLVLCVCDIQKVIVGESVGYKLRLTDGWYSCPALTDQAMAKLIEEGKLKIGTKLVTQGATLQNCEQGISPLEVTEDVYLKISTNSTRRIRWDAKLGFQKNPENFPISLGSILPQGGPITRIDVIIVRIYPVLYMEKTPDGRHVTRNRRSEEKADSEYRRIQEQRMESICNEIQSEMRKSANLDKFNTNSLNNFEQVEDLRQLMESSSDPSALKESMSADQRKLLENLQSNQNDRFSLELREKIEKKMEKEKLSKRNVSEFLRAKIVDYRKPDFNNPAILSVWNVNEDVMALLSEGKVISVMNVTISNSSRIYKPLQINTTRQTQYRQVVRNVKYPARKLTPLKDVSSKVCPAFEEVDIVGVVAVIRDVSYGSRLSQIIYLTDLEMNFVGLVFWGSCKDYGWENVLRISSVVACSNLQWKKNYTPQDVPSLYVNENSVFTENPKQMYLKEEIERLKKSIPQEKTAFLSKCEEDLTTKLEDSKWQTNTSKNSSTNDSSREITKPRVVNGFESKPTASSTPIKPFTTRMDSDEAEPSPIQKRIERLQSYGEPPSLIPLLVRNNARRKFKKKS